MTMPRLPLLHGSFQLGGTFWPLPRFESVSQPQEGRNVHGFITGWLYFGMFLQVSFWTNPAQVSPDEVTL